jgi:hypothetical protein
MFWRLIERFVALFEKLDVAVAEPASEFCEHSDEFEEPEPPNAANPNELPPLPPAEKLEFFDEPALDVVAPCVYA